MVNLVCSYLWGLKQSKVTYLRLIARLICNIRTTAQSPSQPGFEAENRPVLASNRGHQALTRAPLMVCVTRVLSELFTFGTPPTEDVTVLAFIQPHMPYNAMLLARTHLLLGTSRFIHRGTS